MRDALPALLLEFLANALALQIRQVVDEQLAVEVVDLVLDTHRQDVVVIALERLAAAILRAQPDLRRALHFIEDPRHRQTPLLAARFPLAREDLRVDEHQRLVVLGRDVDDDDALVHIDLGRGEPDPGSAVHGLEQVIDERAEGRIEAAHRLRTGAQAGVGELEDGS